MTLKQITLFLTIVILNGCANNIKGNGNENPAEGRIIRFDRDIYSWLNNPSEVKGDSLLGKYPRLLPALAVVVSTADLENNPRNAFPVLSKYYSHPMLMSIYKDALSEFNNTESLEKALASADEKVKQELPGKSLPRMAFHVSGFKENVIVIDSLISISTDKYLGKDYQAYQNFFAAYQIQQMQPQMILRDYLKAWLLSDIVGQKYTTLLDAIIQQGKILYVIEQLTGGYYNTSGLCGYTPEQADWCNNNEAKIWKTIVDQSGLTNQDRLIISGYIDDAPYTIALSPQSPGRVGAWVGLQIVSLYASKTKADIQQIIKTDTIDMLKQSGYNPK